MTTSDAITLLACAALSGGVAYAIWRASRWWALRGWLVVTEPDGKRWLVHPSRELVFRARTKPGYLFFEDVDGSDVGPRLKAHLREIWEAKGGPVQPAPYVARKQAVLARVLQAAERPDTTEPGALSLVKEDHHG